MTMPRLPAFIRPRRQRAFTLVEMVVVIVITGIVAGMVAVFIRLPVQGYGDSVARAELSDLADTASRRIARDLRLALPNSVRIGGSGRYLELLLTNAGGRYLSDSDPAGLGDILSFDASVAVPNVNNFTIVGNPPTGRQAILPGNFIVVYNLGPDFAPADAYTCPAGGACNRAIVTAVNGRVITMNGNPFRLQNPPMPSPSSRFQVVTTPVTYFCDGGRLVRYADYPIQSAQPVDTAAEPLTSAKAALLATQVAGCTFSFNTLANVQRGLVGVTLVLGSAGSSAGQITLVQQVQVNNAP